MPVVQHPLFTHTEHFRGVSYVCFVCSTVVLELHLPSAQFAAMAPFVCCGQGLFPVVLRVQSEATLYL